MDEFTEVKTTGFGSRLTSSCFGIIIGIALFAGSFALIYWNEGRKDQSIMAKTATEIGTADVNANKGLEGQLVAAAGALTSEETLGDDLFLKPDKYISVKRDVEMYAWDEEKETKTRKNVGGSETTTTTYTYVKKWTSSPSDSNDFKHPEGHQNPALEIEDYEATVQNAKVGAYAVDTNALKLPPLKEIAPTPENTQISGGAVISGGYIFKGIGTIGTPHIGNVRLTYSVLPSGGNVTLFGKLSGGSILSYTDKTYGTLYRAFVGSKDEAVATLHGEYVMLKWILRGVGFLLMWFGLSLVFGPISTMLDILPIAGSVSRALIGAVCFVISLVLSIIAILVSIIAHNIVALIVLFAIGLLAVIFFGFVMKKKVARPRTT